MLKTAQNNTDLMALLSKVNAGADKKSAEGLGALGELLNQGEKNPQFAEILASEGALQEVSSEELMSFFKGQAGSEEEIADVFKQLETPQGKELLKSLSFDGKNFVNASGEEVKPQEMLAKIQSGELNQELEGKLEGKQKSVELMTPLKGERKNLTGLPKKTNPNFSDKLRSAEDFMAQRKALGGRQVVAQADGSPKMVKTNSALNQYQKENKVIDNRLIKISAPMTQVANMEKKSHSPLEKAESVKGKREIPSGIEALNQTSENSELAQILSMKNEGPAMDMPKGSEQVKVVDLSQIQSSNKSELINQLSNYIEQAYVAGQDQVDMVVKHDELGQFRINATKTGVGNQVDLEIETMTRQGQQFFAENEAELIKSLTKSGVKLSDVKLVSQNEFMSMGESRSSSNSEQGNNSQGRGEFAQNQQNRREFSSQQDRGRERRQQMWQMAQENMMSA